MNTEQKIQLWLDCILYEQQISQLLKKVNKTIEEAEKKRKELFNINKN